jgi:hypothetical protein
MNPQPQRPCRAALASVPSANTPRPIRIVDWPTFWFFGLFMFLLGYLTGAVVAGFFASPEPTTTPVTVQLGETVLERTFYEDRTTHLRSLSC